MPLDSSEMIYLKPIDKYGLSESKTVSTLADNSAKLKKSEDTSSAVNQIEYQSLVESLLYAVIATKADIVEELCKNIIQINLSFTYLLLNVYFDIQKELRS